MGTLLPILPPNVMLMVIVSLTTLLMELVNSQLSFKILVATTTTQVPPLLVSEPTMELPMVTPAPTGITPWPGVTKMMLPTLMKTGAMKDMLGAMLMLLLALLLLVVKLPLTSLILTSQALSGMTAQLDMNPSWTLWVWE